jgi:hypothetical protein
MVCPCRAPRSRYAIIAYDPSSDFARQPIHSPSRGRKRIGRTLRSNPSSTIRPRVGSPKCRTPQASSELSPGSSVVSASDSRPAASRNRSTGSANSAHQRSLPGQGKLWTERSARGTLGKNGPRSAPGVWWHRPRPPSNEQGPRVASARSPVLEAPAYPRKSRSRCRRERSAAGPPVWTRAPLAASTQRCPSGCLPTCTWCEWAAAHPPARARRP